MLVGYPRPSFVPFLFSICNSICRCSNHPIPGFSSSPRKGNNQLLPLLQLHPPPFRRLPRSTTNFYSRINRDQPSNSVADRETRDSECPKFRSRAESFEISSPFLFPSPRQPVQIAEYNLLLSARRASWNSLASFRFNGRAMISRDTDDDASCPVSRILSTDLSFSETVVTFRSAGVPPSLSTLFAPLGESSSTGGGRVLLRFSVVITWSTWRTVPSTSFVIPLHCPSSLPPSLIKTQFLITIT